MITKKSKWNTNAVIKRNKSKSTFVVPKRANSQNLITRDEFSANLVKIARPERSQDDEEKLKN